MDIGTIMPLRTYSILRRPTERTFYRLQTGNPERPKSPYVSVPLKWWDLLILMHVSEDAGISP